MNKKLIAQLAAGKIALDNSKKNVNPIIICNILALAFPNDNDKPAGRANYYRAMRNSPYKWVGYELEHNVADMFQVEASEFLKEDEEEFVWGEKVKHKNGNIYIYIADHPLIKEQVIASNMNGSIYNFVKVNLSKLPPIKEVTLKEVAEKFGVSVEQIKIVEK